MTKPHCSEPASADAEIASRITNALVVKNINVRTLSDETGISYPTLRRSLKGGRSLTFSEFGRIAESIGVHPSALLPEALARDVA